jgi:hypothetical protein
MLMFGSFLMPFLVDCALWPSVMLMFGFLNVFTEDRLLNRAVVKGEFEIQ